MIKQNKVGVVGLTAIVFSSMVGGGIFNLAQNLAVGAGAAATIAGWIVTGIGMAALAGVFLLLSRTRPDLDAGIYQYAAEGFGRFTGFNIAWGYWLCSAMGNVAYALMLNDALGVLFPELLRHGWLAMALCSCMIWGMFALVRVGVRTASMANMAVSALKFSCIVVIAIILAVSFNADIFKANWAGVPEVGGFDEQFRSTMMVTLWCFIGIEGAVAMSGRAKRTRDVGPASMTGFGLAWLLYVVVSMMCFGALPMLQMGAMDNPSVAYVMKAVSGGWTYYFVVFAVAFSLFGGLIAWTLICAQVPYEAAKVGIMPNHFGANNRYGAPETSLLVSSVAQQVFIIVVMMSESAYMTAIGISGMMVLPVYLSSCLYLVRSVMRRKRILGLETKRAKTGYALVGILASAFCLWMMYAGSLKLLAATSLFYILGLPFYIVARRQHLEKAAPSATKRPIYKLLRPTDYVILSILLILAAYTLLTFF